MNNIIYNGFIIIAIIFLIRSIISYKNKNIIYTLENGKINVTNENYYYFQLVFCIINGTLLIAESLIAYDSADTSFFVFCYMATFCIVNCILKFIAVKMNYLNINH